MSGLDEFDEYLDKHYASIANLAMLIWYGVPMLLIAFHVIETYWILFFMFAIKPINNFIAKKIKQYCIQNKIPAQKIIKFGKISNWLYYVIFIPIMIFCLGYIFYK